jgi:uracil permease
MSDTELSAAESPSVPELNRGAFTLLAIQHVFAMFGATVLVPLLTGLNPSVALISAGLGTLVFHAVTGRQVPVFLGSSFAFIGVIIAVGKGNPLNFGHVGGGLIAAGVLYCAFAGLVRLLGPGIVRKLFPPVVTGPVIMVIGLHLAPVAVGMAAKNWWLALLAMGTIIGVSCFMQGFFRLVPIIIGIAVGYLVASCFGLVDFSPVQQVIDQRQFLISFKDFTLPQFSWPAVATIAPIAIVTFMEHIGDVTTNGAVVGRDFFVKPGLHRTLLGDGLATMLAGFIGGPANTTYSENTGVLAVTRNYNPAVLRLAAVFAILLGLIKPVGAVLQTVPVPVMGGVSFILFGMIASIGMRTISEAQIDFSHSRNLIIVTLILVTGLARPVPDLSPGIAVHIGKLQLAGIGLAALVGLVANLLLHLVLPDNPDRD